LRSETLAKIDDSRRETNARIERLGDRGDNRFHWLVGLMFAALAGLISVLVRMQS